MTSLFSFLLGRLRGPLPRVYTVPFQPKGDPIRHMGEEEVLEWLEQEATPEGVYAALVLGGDDRSFLARHIPARLLTEEVLWGVVGEGMEANRQYGLLQNPDFAPEHVEILLSRLADDLRHYDLAWKRRQALPENEVEHRFRRKGLRALIERGALRQLAERPELLDVWVEALTRPEIEEPSYTLGQPSYTIREQSALVLLRQQDVELSPGQLLSLGRTFYREIGVVSLVLESARTPEVALALWERIPDTWREDWSIRVSQNEALLRSPEVRELAYREAGLSDTRFRVRAAALPDLSPADYLCEIQSLFEENEEGARWALLRYPPPAGTELPRSLAARLLAGGSVDEKLAVMRALGTPAPAYAASEVSPASPTVQSAPSSLTPPDPRSGRRR